MLELAALLAMVAVMAALTMAAAMPPGLGKGRQHHE
jgi:hypothetical protein